MDLNSVITPYFGNKYSLVGVKILDGDGNSAPHPDSPVVLCEAVKEAALTPTRLLLDTSDHACPNAELVLGYVEPRYVELPYRVPGKTRAVLLTNPPEEDSDLVLVIGTPKQVMELSALLGGVSASFGREGSFGLCGEAIARTYTGGGASASLFCQGARVFGDFKDSEMVVALPMEAARELAEKIQDIEKGCTAMCGCLTSDIPPSIIQSFKEAGLEKSTDFFFGKVEGRDVKVYLGKDPSGRITQITVTTLVKGDVEVTGPFRVRKRGNWSYITLVTEVEAFGADIYTGKNLKEAIGHFVKKMVGG
jgi:uncharacterized protein (DUF169 family)